MNIQNSLTIKAKHRSSPSNKIARRECRKEGLIPGIVYSKGASALIAVNAKELPKQHTLAKVVGLDLEGTVKNVLMREVQVNPLTDQPIHFDFQEVSSDDLVTVSIPLNFVGFTKEQEKEGVLSTLLRFLRVKTKVSDLPESFDVDVSALKSGESVRLFDLNLPKTLRVCTGKGSNVALASLVKI